MKEGTLGNTVLLLGASKDELPKSRMSGMLIQTDLQNVKKIAGDVINAYIPQCNVPLTGSPSSNESEEETDTMIGIVILL